MNTIRGMALVEILIGSAIISVGILAASSAYSSYVSYAFANQRSIQASYLLEEGLEVMTLFRNRSWSLNIAKLSTTTNYYLSWSGTDWATTTTAQYVDGIFLRKLTVADVKRGSDDRIASSGTYDPNTKQVMATVDYWQGHATTTKSISTYLGNIYNN